MRQSPLTILNTNHSTLPTTNHNADQSITTFVWISNRHLTLKMTSAQDVETAVTTNSSSQDCFHPDDQIPARNVILELKPFAIVIFLIIIFLQVECSWGSHGEPGINGWMQGTVANLTRLGKIIEEVWA